MRERKLTNPATHAVVVLQTGRVEEEALIGERLLGDADGGFGPCYRHQVLVAVQMEVL